MTHPLFRTYPFIETAFARRFQAMLRSARHTRAFHVIVADPGAGKTTSIRDLQKRAGGRSILAVVTPKNNDDEQALGDHTVRESIPFQKWLLLSDQPLKLNDRSIEKKRSICVTLL
jgi:type II secretory pathway predicted ATPase ExeA